MKLDKETNIWKKKFLTNEVVNRNATPNPFENHIGLSQRMK